jgi:hypothetical protein
MITTSAAPVTITAQAKARIAALGLEAALDRMIKYARQSLPEVGRIEVVLYERDEPGDDPGLAVELHIPFASFDPSKRTRAQIGEWLVSEFPPDVLQHLLIDYLPEAPDAG